MEVCNAKLQVQPELASDTSSKPPAGIILILCKKYHHNVRHWVLRVFSGCKMAARADSFLFLPVDRPGQFFVIRIN